MDISLPPELEQFVQDMVTSGQYRSASEVIRKGLRLLERHEQQEEGMRRFVLRMELAKSGKPIPEDLYPVKVQWQHPCENCRP
jgi:antitoxin ParD1/3/4